MHAQQARHDIKLRVPPEVRDWFKTRASENFSTMNGEILRVLVTHIRNQKGGQADGS